VRFCVETKGHLDLPSFIKDVQFRTNRRAQCTKSFKRGYLVIAQTSTSGSKTIRPKSTVIKNDTDIDSHDIVEL